MTGLAKSPVAGAPIDLSGLPGQVSALAFDGQRLIVGVASGGSGGVYLASSQSAPERIAVSASPSAIALAGSSLYFADNQSQQIWQVQSYATAPAAISFASDSSIDSPAGLGVSADGQRLFVANAGNRKLAVYDIVSRAALQSVDLPFTPTRIDLFGDASVFLLNGIGQGPLYVVRDGGAGKAAVFFVPAPVHGRPVKTPIRPALTLQRGHPPLHQQEIAAHRHQQQAVHRQHVRRGVDRHQVSGGDAAQRHAAAKRHVVNAHHAAAHFVGR